MKPFFDKDIQREVIPERVFNDRPDCIGDLPDWFKQDYEFCYLLLGDKIIPCKAIGSWNNETMVMLSAYEFYTKHKIIVKEEDINKSLFSSLSCAMSALDRKKFFETAGIGNF